MERIRRIAPGAPVILAILFQPRSLPVEIGQPGERCVTLFLQTGEPLLLRARIGARGDQRIARVGEFFRRIALRRLGLARTRLGRLDRGLRLARSLARGLRAGCRIAPAGEHQPCLGDADLVGQLGVAFRLLGLPPERGNLTVEPGEQVFQSGEVGLGLAQLALGILAPHVEPGDPRRFFQHRAPLDRLGRDHVRDLALADECGGVGPGRRIGKGERDVLCAHVVAVDAVGAARAAFDPADDLQLVAGIVRAGQHHFGELARRAFGRACEDHVFHPARAHRLGGGFPHHPADRFEQVGFAAAVGADDPGQPGFDAQGCGLDEALEARQAKLPDLHPPCPLPAPSARPRAGGRLRLRSSSYRRASCRSARRSASG